MNLEYTLIRSVRKSVAIQVKEGGKIVVRAPKRVPKYKIDEFVVKNVAWIERQQERIAQQSANLPQYSEADIMAMKKRAAVILKEKTEYFAKIIGVDYNRISIRNQKTRFGSCSSKGNLNYNCKLVLMPEEIQDYVVVHELCHRKEMNHSPAFWKEVERVMPDYKVRRKWLKENGSKY